MIITKINEAARAIRAIKIKKISEAIEIEAETKRGVSSKIRIPIIILTIREFFAKRVSTRERVFEIIKNFINMLFVKRLCDARACEKTFSNLFKCEQCDINHIIT